MSSECIKCKHYMENSCIYKYQNTELNEGWKKYSRWNHFCENFEKYISKNNQQVLPQIKITKLL